MMTKISYGGYRFPPEIIQQAIWLYVRFTLSFRDVEDLLAERGIVVSYETGAPLRSPQPLFTIAACSGLRPAPDCRPRGALPHLLYSSTPSFTEAVFVTHPRDARWYVASAAVAKIGRDLGSKMVHTAAHHRKQPFRVPPAISSEIAYSWPM
jgi:hypothetical protein